jgi:hypothetical protein
VFPLEFKNINCIHLVKSHDFLEKKGEKYNIYREKKPWE